MSDSFIKSAKIPQRYMKTLERIMNTSITDDSKKWSHFSNEAGGRGRVSAMAGE